MRTLVIYDTKFGNTAKIAEAIARGARERGSVTVVDVAEAAAALTAPPDLLIVGGPTQRRGPSPTLLRFLVSLPHSLRGVPSATFDTRYRGKPWLMGSAAKEAAKRLAKAGARLAAPPESFFIARSGPLEGQGLEVGELERAYAWGRAIGAVAVSRYGLEASTGSQLPMEGTVR